LTSDRRIVLFHDGHEKRFGIRPGFTEKEFVGKANIKFGILGDYGSTVVP
jgi:hypothetical protein